MFYIKDIIQDHIDQSIPTVSEDTPVILALNKMVSLNTSTLIITSENRAFGVFTEKNCSLELKNRKKNVESLLVRDVMSTETYYVTPENTLDETLSIMKSQNLLSIPVIDEGTIVGVVSQKEVVEALLSDRNFLIDQLIKYITGSYSNLQSQFHAKKTPLKLVDLQNDDTLVNVIESPLLKVV